MAKGKKSQDPPAPEENLYKLLGVESDATPDAIKSAYKKKALKHHPDKVSEENRDEAHRLFQQIALAYGVLSDERRRKVYDRTGRTDDAFSEDGDFDWMDFYREQLSAMLDTRAISDFKKKYQNSDEEKRDLLAAFEAAEGDMDGVYESVMLSNVLDDDERFRAIIDEAIAKGEAENYKLYAEEPEAKRTARRRKAQKEAKEAERLAKKLEADKKKKAAGASKSQAPAGEDDLLALITKRQQDRGQGFLAQLEEKIWKS
ncbi:Heat shock protein DnaJ [Penicillium chermesinum]|uniref:Heat shock protein DnaJ n=1 Tax=Penicillium chermesinum TaxID=63820 RepID=A0A9W9NTY6_9EURO|nr:Heat shock protein DnaJ [Penicillium chermesinum]KAJ5225985.1 Heat shock protein DnaJ [Penicillium chermesinum]